jgi:hypothetical protein
VKRLGELGNADAVQILLDLIEETPPHFRKLIAQALDLAGWKPDQGSAGARYWIAKQEWEQCRQVGEPAVKPLLQICFPSDAQASMLVDMDKEEFDWQLSDVAVTEKDKYRWKWRSENEQAGKEIENLIVEIGDGIAIRWLEAMLVSPGLSPETERRAVRLIDQLGGVPASEKAKVTYWLLKEDWAALSRLGTAAVARLREYIFQDVPGKTHSRVLGAVRVICSLGAPEVIPVLIQLLDQPSKEIRILAAQALVDFYKTETLPAETKNLVLAQDAKITKAHSDMHHDFDYRVGEAKCNMWEHTSEHEDVGIGLEFSL